MKRVAKLLIQDADNNFLLLYSNNHPAFGDGADLPGGTVEEHESIEQGLVREVFEEIGFKCENLTELYAGTEYSTHGTHKSLYFTKVAKRPEITLSWEHKAFAWVDQETLIKEATASKDDYMHMVAKMIEKIPRTS